MTKNKRYVHRVDARDRIVHVNAAWCSFARENEADGLIPESLVGTSIWQYVGGFPIRQLYQVICARVRDQQRAVVFPFRCDSPVMRRHLEMRIDPLESGGLSFSSQLLQEEPRAHVPLLASRRQRTFDEELIPMCSWCNRISTPAWVEAEEAIRQRSLFAEEDNFYLTHGICPDCMSAVMKSLDRL